MIFSSALTTDTDAALRRHLVRADVQEDVCFAMYKPSTGAGRSTALIAELILPRDGEREVHGNASFTDEYFVRAACAAAESGAGLALLHSHPGGIGWQGLSRDDVDAEQTHAAQALALTDLPLYGLTVTGRGDWSARAWERTGRGQFTRRDCETVRVVGQQLRVTYNDSLRPAPPPSEPLLRTISAWGPRVQGDLVRLRMGVVGAGSVGAIVAEALGRTGVENIRLLDYDSVKPHNLDRLLHATRRDARLRRAKVVTLSRALVESATAIEPEIEPLELSLVEPGGFAAALDCDVLFSCVDRPWPRLALNQIAYAHLIPVIDGGIRIDSGHGKRLVSAECRAHVAAPGRRCLECLEQYDPGLVQPERDGLLDDPSYLDNLPLDHPLRANQNVFAFAATTASLEISQLISMVAAPSGLADNGAQTYHSHLGQLDIDTRDCEVGCHYGEQIVAVGDDLEPLTGSHRDADEARANRAMRSRTTEARVARLIDRAAAALPQVERKLHIALGRGRQFRARL